MSGAQFLDGALARNFLLGGRACLTLVSAKTSKRFTYRIVQKHKDFPHFVSVLTGPENTRDYSFLGTIFRKEEYAHGRKSRISSSAPCAQALTWALRYLLQGVLPPQCEVWHDGRCGRCGRMLTVPESVSLGVGPECAKR